MAELCMMLEGSRRENRWWTSLDITDPTPTRHCDVTEDKICVS